ncbi:MAG: hypothetical protein H6510_10360 [Acidobacteria bacterium]|nr:hypothetical protein [Acidobacteriota bacterium]MCB9398211.1 hypothetical protein [Acidobacteriota bacterium]
MLTRHFVLAILAFVALIFANVSVFSMFYFRDLSEKMVREHLVQNLNEAQSRLSMTLESPLGDQLDECDVSQLLAPQLRDLKQFSALVVVDHYGTVVHRESLQVDRRPGVPANARQRVPLEVAVNASPANQIAVEYNAEAIEREVARIRHDLDLKMRMALMISLLLLLCAAGYVFWVYRRGQKLQIEAQKADRMAYVGTLASGLAHEIRNPLNSMNMNIQLIEEEIQEVGLGENDELHEMFSSTKREIQRLERLVSSFLSYARPTRLQLKDIQLNEVLQDIAKFLKPELERGMVQLDLELAADLPELPVDESQIRQALLNIIQNAVQVSEAGKRVMIRSRFVGGDKVVITVKDEGPGIAPQELEQVFKVFYSTKRGGTGLGLPIAQRIAESHGGGIKLESEVGKGCVVTLVLPKEST